MFLAFNDDEANFDDDVFRYDVRAVMLASPEILNRYSPVYRNEILYDSVVAFLMMISDHSRCDVRCCKSTKPNGGPVPTVPLPFVVVLAVDAISEPTAALAHLSIEVVQSSITARISWTLLLQSLRAFEDLWVVVMVVLLELLVDMCCWKCCCNKRKLRMLPLRFKAGGGGTGVYGDEK
ncbi:hypothetical protein GQX74_001763 [Glossina fuscipes]|nr:hypothetical protein GQX74_001763 [Glossina fuscipes]